MAATTTAPTAGRSETAVARSFNFGSGMPDPATFPSQALAEAAMRIVPQVGEVLVKYPDPKGWPALRELAVERMHKNHGVRIPLDQVVLTNGSMQPIGLAGLGLAGAGSTIVVESFTYVGTLNAFRRVGADLVGVPLDDQGMRVDALAETLDRLAAEGRKPAFIYTIPSYQNPTGTTLPLERRRQLLEIAATRDILIVEDDCYADVRFTAEAPPPALYALAEPGRVIYIGSFSKILGPGIRLGYVIAPEPPMARLLRFKIDGGISALSAMIVAEYFRDHMWRHIAECNRALKAKRDTLLAALAEHLGPAEVQWTRPDGGLFTWLRLPEGSDMDRVRTLATEAGIQYGVGRSFDAADRDIPYLRLAFGFIDRTDIPDGVAALADCIARAALR
ncbi:MAG TPA: PLP-dependent aminotransferase family protein [Chloroflexota bacterium]|jgi:2-aminoadipate transaminase|nr:PLP-dependent aminotransferase family protein [Chloroflexota bacterium]